MTSHRGFDERLFRKMWADQKSIGDISIAVGRSYKTCQDLRAKLGLPKRDSVYRRTIGGKKHTDPTLWEIEQRCEAVRAGWSDDELMRRRTGHLPHGV